MKALRNKLGVSPVPDVASAVPRDTRKASRVTATRPLDAIASRQAPTLAKLFQNGRSQAVRLPKQFRFEGKEVQVTRRGNGLLLEPIMPERAMSTREFFDYLASYGDMDPMPGGRNQSLVQPEDILPEGW